LSLRSPPPRSTLFPYTTLFRSCPVSGFTIPEIEPRLFSFNNPFGACPACGGLGVEQHIDPDLVIPDRDKSLRGGAIAPWAKSSRSEEHTSELQSRGHLVCRLLL